LTNQHKPRRQVRGQYTLRTRVDQFKADMMIIWKDGSL
jgi:hypothetical protein